MPSRLDICNQAIGEIGAKVISSIDEASLEARECRRFYPQIIAEMLEGPHDWSFQNRRVALALTTNDRESEWAFAYAVPADMGSPIRVIPDLEGLGVGLPVPLPGDPYAEVWSTLISAYEAPYRIENGVLFTNTESATLEYGINAIEEASLTALVVRAIVLELASRLAMPVKKDRKLALDKAQQAELYWQRAFADDLNRQPQRYGGYTSEAQVARAGWPPATAC